MSVKSKIIIIFYICILMKVAACTRWLIDNPGFDDVNSWDSGYLPCAKEQVVFPESYSAVLPLPKSVNVKGFTFPRFGALLLAQDSTIDIGGEANNRPCESDVNAFIKLPNIKSWYDPKSWKTINDVPTRGDLLQVEQVPCSNDSVVMQSKGPLAIDMENTRFLRVGQMYLAGSILSKNYLQYLLNTDIGQILFQNALGAKVEYYRSNLCSCHKSLSDVQGAVCHNVGESCARPHCLDPIKPLGSCCEMCGAVLTFATDDCNNANINKLRRVIAHAIKEAHLNDELDFYVAYVPNDDGIFLQAIIIDRDTYKEKSVAFANTLNATIKWSEIFARPKFTTQSSGRPYNPSLTFMSVLLIILCLVIVAVVGVIILSHYTPNNPYLNRIPQWIHDPRHVRNFLRQRSFVFRRFDNTAPNPTSDGQEIQESAAISYNVRDSSLRERAFDNPMFRENKEQKEAPATSTGGDESPAQKGVENEAFSEENINTEVQELTEIKLDSSSDEESGDEVETVE